MSRHFPSSFTPTFLIFLLGLAAGFWLHIFFQDPAHPMNARQRADRLAAANYLAAEFTAPLPPSPAHWAQRHTGIDSTGQRRFVAARESAAIWIAVCGGNAAVAGVLAFAFAAVCLASLVRRFSTEAPIAGGALGAVALTAISHSQAWQLTDPYPWLILIAGCLFGEGWLRQRDEGALKPAWRLVVGLSLLALSAPALAACAALAWTVGFCRERKTQCRPQTAAPGVMGLGRAFAVPALVCSLLLLSFFVFRNSATTGSLTRSPHRAYSELNVTAPSWFWNSVAIPKQDVDFVIERYDELVAIPATRRPNPVYALWIRNIWTGLQGAGGIVLASAALIFALASRRSDGRPALTVLAVLSIMALLHYGMPVEWWLLLTPFLIERGLAALRHMRVAATEEVARRLGITFVSASLVAVLFAPSRERSAPEVAFLEKREAVVKNILKNPGQHLVFVTIDPSTDAIVEPADHPRDWTRSQILYARDLTPERNEALANALPQYTVWRIIVLRDQIGLQRWKKQQVETPAEKPAAQEIPSDQTPNHARAATTSLAI